MVFYQESGLGNGGDIYHSNDKDIANEANAENDAKGDRDKDSGQLLDHLLIRTVGQGW